MTEVRAVLERKLVRVRLPDGGLERLLRRRDVHRRNQRIVAGVLALVLATASLGIALRSFRSVEQRVPAGQPSVDWVRQFGTARGDGATAVAADRTGIYVAGYQDDKADRRYEGFLAKYDPAGLLLWKDLIGSPIERFLIADLAADGSSVYVAGTADNGGFLSAYDIDGREMWTHSLGGIIPYAVGVGDGTVFLAGSSGSDAVVARYNAQGVEVWTRSFGTRYEDDIVDLATGPLGIFVSGTLGYHRTCYSPRSQGCSGSDTLPGTMFLRAFDDAGNPTWSIDLGSAGYFEGLATDSTNVYVAYVGEAGDDQLVRAVGASGSAVWDANLGKTGNTYGTVVTADGTGVYAAGGTSVTKYHTETGQHEWSVSASSQPAGSFYARASTLFDGSIIVVGRGYGSIEGQRAPGRADAFVMLVRVAG